MPVELYGMTLSAPCRLVALTLDYLEIPYEFKVTNLMEGEHMKPEFLKMNPQHTIPTFKDGDFVLNESRAIAQYLANANDKTGKLYPADPKVRAVVDQRLYFDMGVFYKAFGETVYPKMFGNGEITDDKFTKLKEVLGWVNDFVKPTGYVAGTDSLTIADIAFIATYSTLEAAGHVDLAPYPEMVAWAAKIKAELKNYEKANGEGAAVFGDFYKSKA